MGTQQQQPTPDAKTDEQRPNNKKEKSSTAEQQTSRSEDRSTNLLDKIVSENNISRRDDILLRRAEFDYEQRLAKLFAESGCFKDIDRDEDNNWLPESVSIARALVKIGLGKAMGFTAYESMSCVDIIKGRPAVNAQGRAIKMQQAGWDWPQTVLNNKGCWMPLRHKGQPLMCQAFDEEKGELVWNEDGTPKMVQVVVIFGEEDAKKLGLFEKTGSMYKKDPQSMYFSKAVTRAQRRYAPAVLGINILDTEEAREIEGDITDDFRFGSAAEQAAVAERKVAALKASQKPAPTTAPTEKSAPATAPQATQEAEKPKEAPKGQEAPTGPVAAPERVKYDNQDDIPDAPSQKLGTEIEFHGQIWQTQIREGEEFPRWVPVEDLQVEPERPVAPQQKPAAGGTVKPIFGRPASRK